MLATVRAAGVHLLLSPCCQCCLKAYSRDDSVLKRSSPARLRGDTRYLSVCTPIDTAFATSYGVLSEVEPLRRFGTSYYFHFRGREMNNGSKQCFLCAVHTSIVTSRTGVSRWNHEMALPCVTALIPTLGTGRLTVQSRAAGSVYSHQIPRLRIGAAIPLLPNTPSKRNGFAFSATI
jgi:hypothetical protein